MPPKKGDPSRARKSYTTKDSGKNYNARTQTRALKERTLNELKGTLGVVSIACDKVGVSRQTFYRWKREDPDFAAEVEDIEERALDVVEGCMFNGITAGDSRLIIYYLNNKGRKRGYGIRSGSDDNRSSTITLRISEDESEY